MSLANAFRIYGLFGLLRLTVDIAWTKLTYPSARVIRRPAYIRGTGHIDIGAGFTSGPGLRIDSLGPSASVVIGENVQVNNNVHIGAVGSVRIGNRVLIASGVFIADHNHGTYSGPVQSSPEEPPANRVLHSMPVQIEDDVWLGEHVCVLPGVQIGKGAVVGAGAIVTTNLPAYTIAVGAPARVVKRYDFENRIWVPIR